MSRTSAHQVHAVIGPPGTGKTHYVVRNARRAAERYGESAVMICSLTRAAAREVASRAELGEEPNVGTLHALCYRALGRPKLVESKHLSSWNAAHPAWRLSGQMLNREVAAEGRQLGDELYQRVELYRARRFPSAYWTPQARRFAELWSEWKRAEGLWDFTDLVEKALDEVDAAPGRPDVIFADEAQDLSGLEVELLHKWMRHARQCVLVGDPDQALYAFRGAKRSVLKEDGTRSFRVLSRSFRVPRAPLDEALRLIRRSRSRREVDYEPAEAEGEVIRSKAGYETFEGYLELVAEWTERGESVMVLVQCDYMLSPILAALRAAGIPYHNPYSSRWNPLAQGEGMATWERVATFAKPFEWLPDWSPEELRSWLEPLRARGVMAKTALLREIERLEAQGESFSLIRLLSEHMTEEAVDAVFDQDLDWYARHVLAKYEAPVAYARRIAERGLLSGLLDGPPRVTVGTIHSVKGGEADNVLLFPDLSPAAHRQSLQSGWEGVDSLYRLFYVAMTRTRNRLVLGGPSTGRFLVF